MTSQLNVDTIVDKAGSGGTNVKIGNTSTYVSDGGAVTQNTVQGVLKAWYQFDGTGTVNFRDSFNMSGTTDGGTGTYANAYTTNMGSTNYAILTGEVAQTDIGTQSNSTDHHDILGRQGFDSTTVDVDPFYIGVAGDLA
jgi:hypothetical protein